MTATIQTGDPISRITPTRIEALMTGCVSVDIVNGNQCFAFYEDGTREYGIVPQPCRENFFALVGQVQQAARRNQ